MQKVVPFLAGFLLFVAGIVPTRAAFTSLFIFGDGLSTTTNNASTGPLYYGKRYSNGRVWVEVLAQRQGLLYDSNKNWSYFYNSSTTLVTHVSNFNAPADASNALFVVWVNCADLWFPAYLNPGNMSVWTNAINRSQANHFLAVSNLYFTKGARTLIMPNAVDLSTIPEFNNSSYANFTHLRCLEYNAAFSNTLNQIRASCPDLKLYTPDFFGLLTNMLAHPTDYGLTNALGNGKSIDALRAQNYGMPSAATNGFGTNFIFWNLNNPTAMVHTWMANMVQQMISPVRLSQLTVLVGSNRLDLANVPIGQNGLVLACSNLLSPAWQTNVTLIGTDATQSVYVSNPDPLAYYRLKCLYSWVWP